jgi:hypothetical protein
MRQSQPLRRTGHHRPRGTSCQSRSGAAGGGEAHQVGWGAAGVMLAAAVLVRRSSTSSTRSSRRQRHHESLVREMRQHACSKWLKTQFAVFGDDFIFGSRVLCWPKIIVLGSQSLVIFTRCETCNKPWKRQFQRSGFSISIIISPYGTVSRNFFTPRGAVKTNFPTV